MKIIIPIILILMLSFNIALADTVSGSASINNAAPSVSKITTNSPIDLSSGNATIWCNATATDSNIHSDINGINATLWNPSYTSESASDNIYDHYANSSCSISTNTSITSAPASCSFNMDSRALIGTWTCKLIATDNSSTTRNNSTNLDIYDCGDGVCTAGEACSLCSIDCGACPGTGGRSTGGTSVTPTIEEVTQEVAEEAPASAPTQPPSKPEAKEVKEGLPGITGKAVSPPIPPIPLNVSAAALAALIVILILFRYWSTIKRRRRSRRRLSRQYSRWQRKKY